MDRIATVLAGFFVLWALFVDPVFSDPTKKGSEHNHGQWDVLLLPLLVPLLGLLLLGGAAVVGTAVVVGGIILLTALTVPSTSRMVQSVRKHVREQLAEEDSALNRVREGVRTTRRTVTEKFHVLRERVSRSGGRVSPRNDNQTSRARDERCATETKRSDRKWLIPLRRKRNDDRHHASNASDTQDRSDDEHTDSPASVRSPDRRARVVDRPAMDDPRDPESNQERTSTHEQANDHINQTERPSGRCQEEPREYEHALGVWGTDEVSTQEGRRQQAFGQVLRRASLLRQGTDAPSTPETQKASRTSRKLIHRAAGSPVTRAAVRTQNGTRGHHPDIKGRSRLSRRALAQRLASQENLLKPPSDRLIQIGQQMRQKAGSAPAKARSMLQ